MNIKQKAKLGLFLQLLLFYIFTSNVLAIPDPPSTIPDPYDPIAVNCSSYVFGDQPSIADYISCALKPAIRVFLFVVFGITLVLALYMTWKTFTNWDNQEFLKEMPQRWLYILLLGLVAMGAFGTIINIIVLPILGLGDVDTWLVPVNDLLNTIREIENEFWGS